MSSTSHEIRVLLLNKVYAIRNKNCPFNSRGMPEGSSIEAIFKFKMPSNQLSSFLHASTCVNVNYLKCLKVIEEV